MERFGLKIEGRVQGDIGDGEGLLAEVTRDIAARNSRTPAIARVDSIGAVPGRGAECETLTKSLEG